MGFFIFLFVCNMLVPVIMTGVGFLFESHPPKTINGLYGYRTARSMKSQEAWIFANSCFGALWKRGGVVMTVVSLIPCILSYWMDQNGQSIVSLILITFQCIALAAGIYPVEKALKENFDQNGKPIDKDN